MRKEHSLIFVAVTCLAVSLLVPAIGFAQDSTPDAAKQALQNEKDKAVLRAAIAKDNQTVSEANAAAAKATIGSINTDKLPQGNLTADQKMAIEGTILAYRSAVDAEDRIVDVIAPKNKDGTRNCPATNKMAFYSAKEFNDVWSIAALLSQLDVVIDEAGRLGGTLPYYVDNVPSPEFAPSIVFAGIDAAVSLISLFKTDVTYTAVSVTGDDNALQAGLARILKKSCPSLMLINPQYYQGDILPASDDNSLLHRIRRLNELGITLQAQSDTLEATDKLAESARLDDIKSENDSLTKQAKDLADQVSGVKEKLNGAKAVDKSALEKQLNDLNTKQNDTTQRMKALAAAKRGHDNNLVLIATREANIKNYLAMLDKLSTDLAKSDDSGMSALQRMLKAESFRNELAGSDILTVKFVLAGGNNITKKNIFHTTIAFSGGSVLQFLFMDKNGLTKASGLFAGYGGRIKEGDLNSTLQ